MPRGPRGQPSSQLPRLVRCGCICSTRLSWTGSQSSPYLDTYFPLFSSPPVSSPLTGFPSDYPTSSVTMPPHSEVENDPLVDVRLRRRKRSRSISPRHFRKTSERHEFNNNHEKYCLNRNVSGSASTSSSRSSSVSSEVRLLRAGSSSTLMVSMRTSTTPSAISRQPVVVNFHEAPSFLQFNPFIYRGYRTNLGTVACIRR